MRVHLPDALELAAGGAVHPEWVVSTVLDWEELPEQLPQRHSKPVFVRDLPGNVGG